jgi:hypothetical protein
MTRSPNTDIPAIPTHQRNRVAAVLTAALILVLLIASFCLPARADDDDEDEPANPQVAVQPNFVLTPEIFDQWMFGGVVTHPGKSSDGQLSQRCQAVLELRINAIDRVCTLSDAQKAKLRLAASGDIKRFCDDYEQLRQKYLSTKHDQSDVNRIFTAIQPLRQQWQNGILSQQSLFQKVFTSTLQPDQIALCRDDETSREKARYQAKIKLAIVSLDNTLVLTDAQRQELEKLLLATPLPKKFGANDFYYVMWQATSLPEEKLQSLLDAHQKKIFRQISDHMKSYKAMLEQQGVM